MPVDSYVIRRAQLEDIPLLPAIERRAVRQFEGWLRETGLTPAMLQDVSSIDELEEAHRQGHLWVATVPDGSLVGFAQVVILRRGFQVIDVSRLPPEHVELVAQEQARGLRTEHRVMMEHKLPG